MTHQATANKRLLYYLHVLGPLERVICFQGTNLSISARSRFLDGRTDTMRETNDHLFSRGLVDQLEMSCEFRDPLD